MTISTQIQPQNTFEKAILLLNQLISSSPPPESDKLLGETVRICGQALQAGGAGMWVTENPDAPALVLEHNMAGLGLLQNGAPLQGLNLAVRRAVREGKPLIVPAYFVDNEANDLPVNPSAFELLFTPMRLHGKVAMVLVMAVPATNDTNVRRVQITFLQRMLATVETALAQRHISLIEKDRGTASKIVQFAQRVHAHLFLNQVAVDMANLMRDVVGADRVTAELYPRFRKKVVAVSNVDEPNKRAALFQAQRLILEYVRDRNVPVVLDRQAAKQLVSDPVLQDAAEAYFMIATWRRF